MNKILGLSQSHINWNSNRWHDFHKHLLFIILYQCKHDFCNNCGGRCCRVTQSVSDIINYSSQSSCCCCNLENNISTFQSETLKTFIYNLYCGCTDFNFIFLTFFCDMCYQESAKRQTDLTRSDMYLYWWAIFNSPSSYKAVYKCLLTLITFLK